MVFSERNKEMEIAIEMRAREKEWVSRKRERAREPERKERELPPEEDCDPYINGDPDIYPRSFLSPH